MKDGSIPWETWLSCLSPDCRATITGARRPPNDEDPEFAAWIGTLSPQTQKAIGSGPRRFPTRVDAKEKYRFGVFVLRHGDIPALYEFLSLEELVRFIGDLQNEDVYVFPYFGVAMPKGDEHMLPKPNSRES